MGSKVAKEAFVNKLGFKSSGLKAVADSHLKKLKKENAPLTLDEMSKRNGRHRPAPPEKVLRLFRSEPVCKVPSGQIVVVQEQLRDALEKNQQWIVYDQQREAYVQGILASNAELEQQLKKNDHHHKEANSEGQSSSFMQQEKQLQESQRELEEEQKRVSHLQAKLEELKSRYEEKSHEVVRVQEELREERRSGRQTEKKAADVRLDERITAIELLLQDHILNPTSPIKSYSILDESILECPNCRAPYPASQHRELLAHLDYCFN